MWDPSLDDPRPGKDELKKLVDDYTYKTPNQRLHQLLEYKKQNDKRKIAIYAMIIYKDILLQRKLKNLPAMKSE